MNWQGLKARPAHSVSVCLQTPDVHHIEQGNRQWLVLGGTAESVMPSSQGEGRGETFEERLCRQDGDVTVILVKSQSDSPVSVDLWRGLSSGHDLYLSVSSYGKFIVADNFSDLITQIPLAERHLAAHAAVDHMLFRTVPGEETYLTNVYRLGHGSHLRFDCKDGRFVHRHFEKIIQRSFPLPYTQQIDLVDDGLESVLSKYRGSPSVAGLFSGGVDSTLNQSYLNTDNDAINLVPSLLSEEWQFQANYASRAAKLLGVKVFEIPVLQENMHQQMADMSRRVGLPLRDYNIGMYVHAFSRDWKRYVIGERADALFGAVGTRIIKVWDSAPRIVLEPLTSLLASATDGRVALRAKQLQVAATQLKRSIDDPWGYGALMSCHGFADFDFLKEIFGEATVADRLDARARYVRDRVELSSGSSHDLKHLELAHWVDYFCEDGVIRIRQLAHSYGKVLICPYLSGPVVRSALSVPPAERFIRGMSTKHLLKAVLKKRVPNYPIRRRKGITGIRFCDHYPNGDLSRIWEDAPLPDFLPKSRAEQLRNGALEGPLGPDSHAWNLVAWSLWRKYVLSNEDLTPAGQMWMF